DLLDSQEEKLRYAACEVLALKGSYEDQVLFEDILFGGTPSRLKGESLEEFLQNNEDVQSSAAYAVLSLDKQKVQRLGGFDWVVMVLFLLLMVGIGLKYSKRSKNKEDYFLGGRTMNPVMVGLSLFATLLSSLSYLAYPGEMIKYGPMMFFGILSYPLAYFIIGKFIIPKFMELNVSSAYEVLEVKLGPQVRNLGTIFFLLL